MTDTTMFPLGAKYIYGGSIATVVGTGTTYRQGTPMPLVFISCPDFGPGIIRLVGNQTYNLGDIAASEAPVGPVPMTLMPNLFPGGKPTLVELITIPGVE